MRGVRDRFTDGSENVRRERGPIRVRLIAGVVVVTVMGGIAVASAMLEPEQLDDGIVADLTSSSPTVAGASARTPSPSAGPTSRPTSSPTPSPKPTGDAAAPETTAGAGPTVPPGDGPSNPTSSPSRSAQSSPGNTAARFVDAWLATDQQQRADGLDRWAVPALARSLKQTDPNAVPATARDRDHPPEVIESSEYLARYEVFLRDGTSVLVDVVGDGSGGWMASAVTSSQN